MLGRNERDTCREFVVPRLEASGWRDSYQTEYLVRSELATTTALGGDGRVDYLLEVVTGLPVGVVEAKREYSSPGQGLQQAVEYAVALDLPTAIASDGQAIVGTCRRGRAHRGRVASPRRRGSAPRGARCGLYTTRDFERVVSLLSRTEAAGRHRRRRRSRTWADDRAATPRARRRCWRSGGAPARAGARGFCALTS